MFHYPNADAHAFAIRNITDRNTGADYSPNSTLFNVERTVYGVQIWSANAQMAEFLSGHWVDFTFEVV